MSELDRLVEKLGMGMSYEPVDPVHPWAYRSWGVSLTLDGRSFSCFFSGGQAVLRPTIADVVSSLCLDMQSGEMSYGEFCSEFGCDPAEEDDYETWMACREAAPKVRKFFGAALSSIQNAEH